MKLSSQNGFTNEAAFSTIHDKAKEVRTHRKLPECRKTGERRLLIMGWKQVR
jgi:hypothetical protein